MIDELGDQPEPEWEPTEQEQRMEIESELRQSRALSKRTAQHAKDRAGILRLEKRFGASVLKKTAKPCPKLPEALNDAESNARERMLRVQAETLHHEQTDEEYAQRCRVLEQQKIQLLKGD